MKKIIKYTIILVIIFSLYNCSEDYFDVNTPSNGATEDQLRMADLIGPATFNTFSGQYWAERSLGNYSQYFTGQGGGATGVTSLSSTWSTIYLDALPNLKVLIDKAQNLNATHFEAVGKIITAINLGLLTDNWDNVPYTEATQNIENLQPAFDLQSDIYSDINTLLTEAINLLSNPDNSGFAIESDMIYGGNVSKWLKAAYTLRARYKMHLSEKDGISAVTSALADLQNGFTSNDDDFQMNYPDNILNPWYARNVKSRNTGNDHDKIGDQLVSYMNGTSYPFNTISVDPRLDELFVRLISTAPDVLSPSTDPWRGYVSGGDGLSSDGENGNVNFKDGGFYTSSTSPIIIISYAEAEFLKAEAEFLINGGNETSIGTNANAYSAYLNGIQANMDKLGVDATDYVADASISIGEAGLMLQHIMKEKYIANFLNPETFVDLRRYNFSINVFKDLSLPANNIDSEYPGEWLIRANYPASEETRNPDNVNLNKKAPTFPVWWDE